MLQMGFLMSSVLHVFFVALNHFCGIMYPLKHKRLVSGTVRKRVLYSLWIVPPVLFIVFCSVIPNQAFQSPHCLQLKFTQYVNYRAAVFIIIFLPMVLTFVLYLRIAVLLTSQKHRNEMLTQNQSERNHTKFFITMILITGSFLIGWLPSCSIFLLVCPYGCPLFGPRTLDELRYGIFLLLLHRNFPYTVQSALS